MDVVDALEGLPTDGRDRPREPAVIEKVEPSAEAALDPAMATVEQRQRRRGRHRRREPRDRRGHRAPCPSSPPEEVAAMVERARAAPARLGGARLRGPREGPAPRPEVGRRQRGADRRDDRLGDRQDATRTRSSPRSATPRNAFGFWAKHAAGLPGRREGPHRQPVRARPQARRALPPARRRRRHRAVELPADELASATASRRSRRATRSMLKPAEVDPAHLAADARVHARVRAARGRLPGRDRRAARPAPALVDHVDMIMFTGSTETGKQVMRARGRARSPRSRSSSAARTR